MPNDQACLDEAASRDFVASNNDTFCDTTPLQNRGEVSAIGLAASLPQMFAPHSPAPHDVKGQGVADDAAPDNWGFTQHLVYVAHADKLYDVRSDRYLKIAAVERLYANDVGGSASSRAPCLRGRTRSKKFMP